MLFLADGCFLSLPASAAEESPAARYQRIYEQAKTRWDRETNNAVAGWEFARACFDWADLATTDATRREIAGRGIAAARAAIRLDPKSAPAYYYLGMNLGQVAQTKRMGALKLLTEMETAWMKCIELDARVDYGGADRSLGLLYRDAPGWPASIGDRSKARLHLKKALELAPGYPDNQLNMLESYLQWGDKKALTAQLPIAEETMKSARTRFVGEAWILAWKDWDQRWAKIKAKVQVNAAASAHVP